MSNSGMHVKFALSLVILIAAAAVTFDVHQHGSFKSKCVQLPFPCQSHLVRRLPFSLTSTTQTQSQSLDATCTSTAS